MGLLVNINHDIPDEDVSSLLTCALEGGSNYWYMIEDDNGDTDMDYCDIPLTDLGWVDFSATCDGEPYEHDGKKLFRLDRAALKRGMQILSEKFPRHFADVMRENTDADTGDAFLQCCLFGDIIFG